MVGGEGSVPFTGVGRVILPAPRVMLGMNMGGQGRVPLGMPEGAAGGVRRPEAEGTAEPDGAAGMPEGVARAEAPLMLAGAGRARTPDMSAGVRHRQVVGRTSGEASKGRDDGGGAHCDGSDLGVGG
jgi:hypothetical protein